MKTLSKREKLLLKVLLSFVVVLTIYYIIIIPLTGFIRNSGNDTDTGRNDIEKLERIYNEYREIKQKSSDYMSMLSKKNENTTSLIEQWASSTGIAKNIAYTRSSQSNIQNKYTRITTDMKIEGVFIQQFVKFLYEVENSDNLLKINYLRIQPALKGTNTYDINLKIDNFILK
ncbi:MAG: type II secretion system protein M [Spirochaetes bacterium]|nr:type II secretion system protein M [Spirochaetota bacterium]